MDLSMDGAMGDLRIGMMAGALRQAALVTVASASAADDIEE
jgi:hypothetical protein